VNLPVVDAKSIEPVPNQVLAQTQNGLYHCQSYQAISYQNQMVHIPSRDRQGTCFYMLISPSMNWTASGNLTELDPQIIARDHERGTFRDSSLLAHPRIMATALLRMKALGHRKIYISSDRYGLMPMEVDNFMLVGFALTSQIADIENSYRAYGAQNSTINGTQTISVNNHPVPFYSFGLGGEGKIPSFEVGQVEAGGDYTVDFRALDCGIAASMSSVYLVFE
jgi:hypothetical protein